MIYMFEAWKDIVISKIAVACYVPAGTGKSVHDNRPYHGLVYNNEGSDKDYIFSDGTVMKTLGNELFYLPKNSSYVVKSYENTGCYAINFDSDMIPDKPFTLPIKNTEQMIKLFRESELAWKKQTSFYKLQIVRNLYDIICKAEKEQSREYQPKAKELIIEPAVEILKTDFNRNDISVAGLADMCGITEAYFRRIFIGKFGMTPKEYIISKRINYAKKLLLSGDFTVTQIANMCGYSEPCHFSREFLRNTGVSPSKFIEK